MTPYEIKLLMDIYSVVGWQDGRNEPILTETLSSFYNSGLIDGSCSNPRLTSMGRAHVIQLCNLRYPTIEIVWTDQFGNNIPDTI